MKSLINNVIARWHLGCWMTNNSEDPRVTKLFLAILDKPWKSIATGSHYTKIVTRDGETIEFWNANKYYSWASNGCIRSSLGISRWDGGRPQCMRCISWLNA